MELNQYSDAEAFLNGLVDYEKILSDQVSYDTKTFNIENFRTLLRELGDPHLKYAAIHVAGTKGKGSTCAFLANIMKETGCKVGLYTSPHVSRYTERIQIDGVPIAETDFCRVIGALSERSHFTDFRAVDPLEGAVAVANSSFRTVFEFLTAAAFVHFAEQEVDIAIIETGLGGRLDSTNVFDQVGAGPLVTVLTAISLDHMTILGDSIDKIATEKSGILRSHAVAVLGPQPSASAEAVQQAIETRLVEIGRDEYLDSAALIECKEVVEERPDGTSSPDVSLAEFTCDLDAAPLESALAQSMVHGLYLQSHLLGNHQLDNIRTALAALLALENSNEYSDWASLVIWRRPECQANLERGIAPDAVRRGISKTRWPGRFEVVSRHPLEIVDGAHCEISATAMADTYRDLYGAREAILVVGFLRDKSPETICVAIKDKIPVVAIICCTPPTPRGMKAEDAASIVRRTFSTIPVEAISDPVEAARIAMDLRDGDQALLVCGSMYLIGTAKHTLREATTHVSGF